MNKQFGVLAQYYDKLNYNANYKKVADYIESIFGLYNKKPELVLDLACGTGNLTLELSKRGYDMIGLDLSAEMLNAASFKNNCGKNIKNTRNMKNILWINQDMCDFELYGTVDAVVCCFDSINYILDANKIEQCFKLVYHYLNPGGLFLFDVNSKYKFEKIYGKNDIILEKNGLLCAWQNNYNKKSMICEFFISLFIEQNGEYKRLDEIQYEKYHDENLLVHLLELAGFSDLKTFYDFDINKYKTNPINLIDKTGKTGKKNKTSEKIKKEFERICFSGLK